MDKEAGKTKFFRTEVLKDKLAGLRVTAKGAADEVGTVGRTGPGGDTPQGPGLECKLAKGELIVFRSRQPVLDDDGRVPSRLVGRVPGLRWDLFLDGCNEPRNERILRRRWAAEDGHISRSDGRPVVGHITEGAGTGVPAICKELGQLGHRMRKRKVFVHIDGPGG